MVYPSNYYLPHDPIRSITLINTNISTDAYCSLDIPHSDISAIRLSGDFSSCSIFNIYNDCTNNNTIHTLNTFLHVEPQSALPSPSDCMISAGDFNCHHPLWESDTNHHLLSPPTLLDPLLDLLTEFDMIQALLPGLPTLETPNQNWTQPDNFWHTITPHNPIIACNTDPSCRPPKADHLPIITDLDLTITRAEAKERRNMRLADYKKLNEKLSDILNTRHPAAPLNSGDELDHATNDLISTIQDATATTVPISKPSPYTKGWWTAELTDLKREANRLSKIAYHFQATPEHPSHAQHKLAAATLSSKIEETKKKHWTDWLKEATPRDIYIANKYLNAEPTDYSSSRIPDLKVKTGPTDSDKIVISENSDKAKELISTFFPPPPPTPNIPNFVYPEPLKHKGRFTRDDICSTIKKLKPFKAPGEDGIQNIVLQQCVDVIIDRIYFIFHAILELDAYPDRWLIILTIILCKAGKTSYNYAKSFHPIGLLNILGKLFSSLVATDLSFLTEKHGLLPHTQFSGRPGRTTSNAMHLLVQKIHNTWRTKKVAAVLFLDVQAAFPNTVKERLLHNLRKRRVPNVYVNLFSRMLMNRRTQLLFNDFVSEPMDIANGTTQGCPLSMLLYAFYNADLIEIAQGKDELASGYVDDCALLATGSTLDDCHLKFKEMMERPNGCFDWSYSHNSPFELSKVAVMDFP